jgi:TolB-like protein
MDDILKEQGFQQSGCTSSECVVEVGNMLGVQQMVGGSIGKVGNIYTVSARIIDIESGKVLKSSNYDHIGDIEQLLINGMEYVVNQLVTKNSPQLSSQSIRSKSKIRYLSIDKDKAGKMKQKNKILIGSIFSLWIIWGLLPPV